ncbi:MAG: lysophospholipase [Phaeodactylibacter sp.]|nr:lysophospholipase [Phaeodactylibacter sp.]MCB9275980.1 lysophospholipase [Lewinellaceae bacterium]
MEERTFDWKTNDGIRIFAREWAPKSPKGAICLVHGLGEHIGRYEHFAHYYTKKGFSVLGYDRRGHGQSGGKRGHAPNIGLLLDEIAQLLVETKVRYGGLPVFLYGHSMGGNLVLSYVLKRHPDVQGVVASAPWIRLAFPAPQFKVALGKVMKSIFPGFSQSNGLKTEHLSKDPDVVRLYEQDLLTHDRITAAMGIGMLEQANWLDNFSGHFPCPLLLMHGSEDHIVSPEGSRDFSRRAQGEVTYREWEGLYHEIHNEREQQEVFDFTLHWLQGHMEMKSKLKTA